MVRDLDLDLGSDQGHDNIHSTCRTTCRPNHVTVALRSTEIWPFECLQISILDEVWTLMIAFLDGNSKIGLRQAVVQAPYYGYQPSVLSSTPKWRRRMCSYVQLSEVQMLSDLDLDLGSGQGHVNIHNMYGTTCMLNDVTVMSRTTEIWPFEFRQILILDEVWTLVIAFLDGN